MRIKSSLKSLKERALKQGGDIIRRKGKILIISKKNKRLKAKQG
jgi:ribosomal protein L36